MSQADRAGPWIIVGGASRAGRALAARLGGEEVVPVVRSPAGLAGEHLVPDFDAGPGALPLNGAIVVNCAGTPSGSAAELDRANRAVPLAWARAAAQAGVARFVQVSSFSVFGPARHIDAATPAEPASDYGGSKFAAEEALRAAGLGDRLTILRVPILIGGGADKLAQLLGLVRRTRLIPAAPWPTPRSMLSYDGLAAAIVEAAYAERGGTLAVADPRPFTPEMLEARARAAGLSARILRVPSAALALVRRAVPGIHASLFEPSLLDHAANAAPLDGSYERIDAVIDRLLAR